MNHDSIEINKLVYSIFRNNYPFKMKHNEEVINKAIDELLHKVSDTKNTNAEIKINFTKEGIKEIHKYMHNSDNKNIKETTSTYNKVNSEDAYQKLLKYNMLLDGKPPFVNTNIVLTGNTELDHIFHTAINSIVDTATYKNIKQSNLKYSSFFMGQYQGHNIELSSDKKTLYHLLHILNGNNQYNIQVVNHSIISSESETFHTMHLNLDRNTMDMLRPFEFYLNLIEE